MSKIKQGTFDQVEPSVSSSFVENSLDTVKSFKRLKRFIFIVLYAGIACYGLYAMSVYIENNMEEAVGGLDVTNEFIPFLSSIWYIHFQAFFIVAIIGTMMIYRQRNRMKASLLYHIFFTIFLVVFGLFLFKMFQLLVSYFIVRMIYTVLYIGTLVYSIWKGYQNSIDMIYGTKKERPAIVEWFSKKSKSVLTVLGIIGGAYFLLKAGFEPAANMERRIIGSLVDFLPLISVGSNVVLIYYIGLITRNYYIVKFQEQFRKKFGYEKDEWYGPNYKETP